MRYFIAILFLLALTPPDVANAKRGPVPKVAPLKRDGIRYVAPNDKTSGGYIQARDAKTDKLLWEVTVYKNSINPFLEEDVQWVLIKKLSFVNNDLVVVDERNRAYTVDLKTHKVRPKSKRFRIHDSRSRPDFATPRQS